MSRRTLLAGGAVALLTGCGEEDDVVAAPEDALERQLAAEHALAAATAQLPTGAPRSAAATVREISSRADARARKLATALSSGDYTIERAEGPVTPEEAVARAQAAIVAHVVALPSLAGRALRRLGADLVAGAAADTALLSDALGLPVDDPFPGTPA